MQNNGELTREDVLALRLEIAELRREMAELRREIAARGWQRGVEDVAPYKEPAGENAVSDEQVYTEWTEGEDAWKAKEKK